MNTPCRCSARGWTLATLVLVYELTRRLTRQPTALFAVALLACTEPFITAGVSNRIDLPMVFFSLLAAAPVFLCPSPVGKRGRLSLVISVVALLCAVAIKGPFGGVLFASAVIARAVSDREWRWLAFGACGGLIAVLPIALFLHGSDDWWRGYVETQLLASARGTRTDGSANPLFPLIAIASHCWPLLALVPFGLTRVPRPVLTSAALSIVVLMIPGRRLWQHTLIVWPVLAVIAGVGAERLPRALIIAVTIGGLMSIGVVPRGRARSCLEFREQISGPVSVVASADGAHWREIAVLAAELRVEPALVSVVPAGGTVILPDRVEVPEGFTTSGNARGWTLIRAER